MKGDYNIQDRELFQALKILSEALDEQNVSYFIFGGVAAQAQIASMETESGRKDIKTVDSDKLRKTGDIDMYIADENAILFFNELAALNPQHRIVNKPSYVEIGPIMVNYVTEPFELKGFEELVSEQLIRREELCLRRGNTNIRLEVSPIEYLIAAKLSGNSIQVKDEKDIHFLVEASKKAKNPINQEVIRDLLKSMNKEDRYFVLEQLIREGI